MTGWVVGDPTTGATGLLNPPVGGPQWSSNAIPRPDQATQTVYDRVDRSPRAPSRAQQQPSPPHTAGGAAPSSGCEGAALPTGVLLPGAKGDAMKRGNFRVNAPPNRQKAISIHGPCQFVTLPPGLAAPSARRARRSIASVCAPKATTPSKRNVSPYAPLLRFITY
jgi:hypothetical protein